MTLSKSLVTFVAGLVLLFSIPTILADGQESKSEAPIDHVAALAAVMKPLENPSVSNARSVRDGLTDFANSCPSGSEEKRIAEHMVKIITVVFTAERGLENAHKKRNSIKQEATELVNKSKHWLQPNAFGTTSPILYENARRKAGKMIAKADETVNLKRAVLAMRLKQASVEMQKFADNGDSSFCQPLTVALKTIATRSLDIPNETSNEQTNEILWKLVTLVGLVVVSDALQGDDFSSEPNDRVICPWCFYLDGIYRRCPRHR